MATTTYTAIIEKEGDGYVALCPELDIASQGTTIEEAKANLKEAVELFLESADPEEIRRGFHGEIFVTRFEHRMGRLRVLSGREVCRILERHGFVEVRRRGSHVVMQRRTADGSTTVRQRGVARSEFVAL